MLQSPTLPKMNTYLSPSIPRFKHSMHQEKVNTFRSPQLLPDRLAKNSQLFWKAQNQSGNTVRIGDNKEINDQKQNLSPLLFQQNMEIIQKPKGSLKRPFTSYEAGSHQRPLYPAVRHRTKVQITEFNLDDFQIDAYCTKMTKSIILEEQSPQYIPDHKQVSQPVPLSEKDFLRLKKLGAGKYGQVSLVMHKKTGFICAMKVIDKAVIREQKMEHQIAKQLKIHDNLKCMNVIEFYGYFDDTEKFYILLEYASEGSVYNRLKGNSRLQQQVVQPIAKGLCDGLSFIHQMGYVHRDIKPQNIVLQFGVPKICDFGWATICDKNTCNQYCGTPLYISPEMVRKEQYRHSVDVWAMGLVVYELIVGRGPFRIWSETDMKQVLQKEIQFPSYVDRTYELENFVKSCLEKYPIIRTDSRSAQNHKFIKRNKSDCNLEYDFFEFVKKCLN